MKKVFVEPEMHKIELNLQENIAASGQTIIGYNFLSEMLFCPIVYTGKYITDVASGNLTMEEANKCAVYAQTKARSLMRFYPKEEVLPYFRR